MRLVPAVKPRSAPSHRLGDLVALVRLAFPVMALAAMSLRVPYSIEDESVLSFLEIVERRRQEIWWLTVPALACVLIAWERVTAHGHPRRGLLAPRVSGPLLRMACFVVAVRAISRWTAVPVAGYSPKQRWEVGHLLLVLCVVTTVVGIAIEIWWTAWKLREGERSGP